MVEFLITTLSFYTVVSYIILAVLVVSKNDRTKLDVVLFAIAPISLLILVYLMIFKRDKFIDNDKPGFSV